MDDTDQTDLHASKQRRGRIPVRPRLVAIDPGAESTVNPALEALLGDDALPFHVLHQEMALQEAQLAHDEEEVPIGCVIVFQPQWPDFVHAWWVFPPVTDR